VLCRLSVYLPMPKPMSKSMSKRKVYLPMSKKLPAYVKETFGSLPTTCSVCCSACCSVCCVASLSTCLRQSLSAFVKAKSLPADVQETFESLPADVKQTLPCQKETTESHDKVIYSLTETLPLTEATQSLCVSQRPSRVPR